MNADGLTKLIEECGELTQIAAKKIAYTDTDIHPDGGESMKKRLEDEIADVLAACEFVIGTLGLSEGRIGFRRNLKFRTFRAWHEDKNV